MPMMATTLIMANQNSISPKALTLSRLMALMMKKKTSADTQVGMPGHQYWT